MNYTKEDLDCFSRWNEFNGGEQLGIFRSVLGLPFKAYAVVCAPVAIFCPPVATVAMSSWMIGAGIAGDGSDD